MAQSRRATDRTCSSGTYRNFAFLSMNLRMSQGQAIRSTFASSRVIHFLGGLPRKQCSRLAIRCRSTQGKLGQETIYRMGVMGYRQGK